MRWFGLAALLLFGTVFQLNGDACRGRMDCPNGDELECSVDIPAGGYCDVTPLDDFGLSCISFQADGQMYETDTPICWPGGSGGVSTTPECDGSLSGAWWVGCTPFLTP